MNVIKVGYQPEISELFRQAIVDDVNEEFKNDDTAQFCVNLIEEEFINNDMDSPFLNEAKNLVYDMQKENITYIEINLF